MTTSLVVALVLTSAVVLRDPVADVPRPQLPMSRAAHRAFRDAEFRIMNRNGDGVLTRGDIAWRLRLATGHASRAGIDAGVRLNCGCNARRISYDRFTARGDAEFSCVDSDGDGVVTAEELARSGGFHECLERASLK